LFLFRQSIHEVQPHESPCDEQYESSLWSTSDEPLTDSEPREDNPEQRSNTPEVGFSPAFTRTSFRRFLQPCHIFGSGISGVFSQRAATSTWGSFRNSTFVGALGPAWWTDSSTNVEPSGRENSDSDADTRHHMAVKRNVRTSAESRAIGTSHKSPRPYRITRPDWDDGFDADDEGSDSD